MSDETPTTSAPTKPTDEQLAEAATRLSRGLRSVIERQLIASGHPTLDNGGRALVAQALLRAGAAVALEANLGPHDIGGLSGGAINAAFAELIADGRRARRGEDVPQPPFDLTAMIGDALRVLVGAETPTETPAAN